MKYIVNASHVSFFLSHTGRVLGVSPDITYAVIPCTTTAGLAITMTDEGSEFCSG